MSEKQRRYYYIPAGKSGAEAVPLMEVRDNPEKRRIEAEGLPKGPGESKEVFEYIPIARSHSIQSQVRRIGRSMEPRLIVEDEGGQRAGYHLVPMSEREAALDVDTVPNAREAETLRTFGVIMDAYAVSDPTLRDSVSLFKKIITPRKGNTWQKILQRLGVILDADHIDFMTFLIDETLRVPDVHHERLKKKMRSLDHPSMYKMRDVLQRKKALLQSSQSTEDLITNENVLDDMLGSLTDQRISESKRVEDARKLRNHYLLTRKIVEEPEKSQAIPKVLPALGDENDTVRACAASILGSLRSEQSIGLLTALLMEDESVEVRRQSALALGDIGHIGGVPPLITALSDESQPPRVQDAVAESIWHLRDAIPMSQEPVIRKKHSQLKKEKSHMPEGAHWLQENMYEYLTDTLTQIHSRKE